MGVYSNTEIKQAIADGTIVSVPLAEKHISQASLDFTLGHYYYTLNSDQDDHIYNPFDESEVKNYFNGPLAAVPHKDWCDRNSKPMFDNIPADHPIIVLQPGERILAHTHEFIGIRAHGGACEVKARSSWARNGVAICFDAGWIDPGYINRITLEIYNLNKYESIVIPVGERVGQLIFHHTGPVEGDYSDGRGGVSGKYQHTGDLDELIATWGPEKMLPNAYKDKRIMPETIDGLPEGIK
ncbi:MAG: deoxycytidine triphosphate deaminase [Candidatus Saccharibacteria bacterium]